jgi:hypothetical protein
VTRAVADDDEGLNLYSSRRRASALLTDMQGEIVHRWEPAQGESTIAWMHVEPLPSGELLVIRKDDSLEKRAWDSTLLWRTVLRAHHDVAVDERGRAYALVRDRTHFSFEGKDLPVLADSLVVIDPEGNVERRVPLLPLFSEHVSRRRLSRLSNRVNELSDHQLTRAGGLGDLMHTNSVEFLSMDIRGVAPAGSILLSFRAMSRIAILNADMDKVLWVFGEGELDGQHDATQLRNGNILLFDNGLHRNRESRVIELDPRTERIEWSYSRDLFSRLRSGAQELPNGHILITESDTGHALEVTRESDVVWEFWNPDIRGNGENAERGVIYRLNRFPKDFFEPLLDP